MNMKGLLHRAAQLGVSVHTAHLEPGVLGEYYADDGEVYFDIRLSPIEQRCVLAHELGHVHHAHTCEDDARAERQADVYAADLLIDPAEYARVERIHADRHLIADELGVTIDLVRTFEDHCLTRLHGITYVKPRLGAGQWLYRSTAS